MADRLRAYPIDLWVSADHLAMHSADLRSAHARADADIEATAAGWVGESAIAMRAKIAEWQAFTQSMCAALDEHQARFRAAGNAFHAAEARHAASLKS